MGGWRQRRDGAVIRHAVIQSGEVSGLTWGPHERVKRGAWGTSQGSASQYVTVTWQASVTVISMFYFHTLSWKCYLWIRYDAENAGHKWKACVCVCKGEQQRVSGWSLTPILTHQYVTVAHFNALQRSPALHCVYKVLYCMPCIAKGWDLRQAQLMSGQRVSLCQRKAEPPAFSPRELLLK